MRGHQFAEENNYSIILVRNMMLKTAENLQVAITAYIQKNKLKAKIMLKQL